MWLPHNLLDASAEQRPSATTPRDALADDSQRQPAAADRTRHVYLGGGLFPTQPHAAGALGAGSCEPRTAIHAEDPGLRLPTALGVLPGGGVLSAAGAGGVMPLAGSNETLALPPPLSLASVNIT